MKYALILLAALASPVLAQDGTQRIQAEVRSSMDDQQKLDKALQNAASDYRPTDPSSADFDDAQINFIRVFAEPSYRLKGVNTDGAPGAEMGFVAAYDKDMPTVGFSVGYYSMNDKFDSTRSYKLIPVLVRVGYSIPLRPGGPAFTLCAAGGYSINSYESDVDGVRTSLNNSYVLMGQAGFRFPMGNYMAVSVLGGYQYLRPEMQVNSGGQTTSTYVDMGAPFVKLNLEF
ncbi:MAG: hypothetical protein GX410_02960 [Elusimicrobia bacterium]|nr:hypothetical protein [Elusimicrobiota bacterium]